MFIKNISNETHVQPARPDSLTWEPGQTRAVTEDLGRLIIRQHSPQRLIRVEGMPEPEKTVMVETAPPPEETPAPPARSRLATSRRRG